MQSWHSWTGPECQSSLYLIVTYENLHTVDLRPSDLSNGYVEGISRSSMSAYRVFRDFQSSESCALPAQLAIFSLLRSENKVCGLPRMPISGKCISSGANCGYAEQQLHMVMSKGEPAFGHPLDDGRVAMREKTARACIQSHDAGHVGIVEFKVEDGDVFRHTFSMH